VDAPQKAKVGQGAVERVLRWVERRELQGVAAMVVSMHRPLAPLAWSAAMLVGGVVAPLVGPDYYERIEALRDPATFDRLLARLESGGKDGAEG